MCDAANNCKHASANKEEFLLTILIWAQFIELPKYNWEQYSRTIKTFVLFFVPFIQLFVLYFEIVELFVTLLKFFGFFEFLEFLESWDSN